jgi:hypothetical protein
MSHSAYAVAFQRMIERDFTAEQRAVLFDAAVAAEANKPPGTIIPPYDLSVTLVRAGYGLTELEARKVVDAAFASPEFPPDVRALFD